MLYLNENITNEDWIRIQSKLQSKLNKNRITNNSKIEKINIRRVNSSSSSTSSSSSISSSFSTNENTFNTNKSNQKGYIYKKSLNKSRNFFNSSSETLSKLAYKKRKLKFNKIVDEIDKSKRSKSEKRHRSKSNRDSRQLKRSSSSELNILSNSQRNKLKTPSASSRVRLKSIDNSSIFLDDYTNRYNSYGLIPLIPSKYQRPSLPKFFKQRHPLIRPPTKLKTVHFRNNRSRSSPKISVFYSVEYDSTDDLTNNSIVDNLRRTSNNLVNKTKLQDNDVNTLRIKAKIKPNKLKKLKDIKVLESVNSKTLNKSIIGDRQEKVKNYLTNNSKLTTDSYPITIINNSVQNKPSISKKSLKINKMNNLNISNINQNKTVIDNYQYDIDKQISKFNQLKDIDLLATKIKSDINEDNYQKITRQNRIIFYEDQPNNLNEKQVSKYEANLPHLPEELKNAIKIINDTKTVNSAKSPLIRKKLLFNSISKGINQDILENLSVILEEENTHSSKNSSCVNSNAINISNNINNVKLISNKSDNESVQENLTTTASTTKLDDEHTYKSEKSITTITKTEFDTSKIEKASKSLTLEKEKTDGPKIIDEDKVKKDEKISNAFKYLIAKETEQHLKNLNPNTNIKLNELIMNEEKSMNCLKAESKTEIICI